MIKARYNSNGKIPKELVNYEDTMLDGMSDKRKAFLAKIAEIYDPNNNIYKDRLINEREAGMMRR